MPETNYLSPPTAESSRGVISDLVLMHLVSTLTYWRKGFKPFPKAIAHRYHIYKRNLAASARITPFQRRFLHKKISVLSEETKQTAQQLKKTADHNPGGSVQQGAPPRAPRENLSFTFLAPWIHVF